MRPDLPGPMRRRGPRPLPTVLGLPPMMAPGLQPMAAPGVAGTVPAVPPGLDRALVAGIAAYRRHPYRRTLLDPPAIWAEGDSRLLDFGGDEGGGGPPVLFVPSLVNRSYVLDLLPDRSMMRWLAAQGVRTLLLDWGWPGAAERQVGLAGPIGRLGRALEAVRGPVVLAGYCMGGLLALAATTAMPGAVRGLMLLATPWDFAAGTLGAAETIDRSLAAVEPLLGATGTLPVDALQAVFNARAPGAVTTKFRRFATLPPDSPAARDFVALEDWLNDGVPLAAPVAREVFAGWYRDNAPGRGTWAPMGRAVQPAAIPVPAFVAVPQADRIVEPQTALPLATALPGATLHRPAAGHVGMVAGPRAQAELWAPALHWLRRL